MSDDTTPEHEPEEGQPHREEVEPESPGEPDAPEDQGDEATDQEIAELAEELYGDLEEPERTERIRKDLGRANSSRYISFDPWIQNYFSRTIEPLNKQIADSIRPAFWAPRGLSGGILRTDASKPLIDLSHMMPNWQLGKSASDLIDLYSGDTESDGEKINHDSEEQEVDAGDVDEVPQRDRTRAAFLVTAEGHREFIQEQSSLQTEHLKALLDQMGQQVSAAQRLGEEMQEQTAAVKTQTSAHEDQWEEQANDSKRHLRVATVAAIFSGLGAFMAGAALVYGMGVPTPSPDQDQAENPAVEPSGPTVGESGSP